MKIIRTKAKDIYIISHKKIKDNRGFFMRSFCKRIFKKKGINFNIKQINFSFNKKKYTLRGFHYQKKPFSEKKIINCIKGSVLIVLLNINKKSKNYLKFIKIKLDERIKKSLFVSENYATAFLTLKVNTLVIYYMSNFYNFKYSSGLKFNDPKIGVKWPVKPSSISKKDINFKKI
jgi:dTDP-4-dehydrorhamnose 3,5-epimerase